MKSSVESVPESAVQYAKIMQESLLLLDLHYRQNTAIDTL